MSFAIELPARDNGVVTADASRFSSGSNAIN